MYTQDHGKSFNELILGKYITNHCPQLFHLKLLCKTNLSFFLNKIFGTKIVLSPKSSLRQFMIINIKGLF